MKRTTSSLSFLSSYIATSIFLLVLITSLSVNVLGQSADSKSGWDENATAESLGLKPYVAPKGFFPILPWDFHDGFSAKDTKVLKATSYGNLEPYFAKGSRAYEPLEQGFRGMIECGYTMGGFATFDESIEAARKVGLPIIVYPKVDMFDQRGLSEEEIQKKSAEIEAIFKEVVEKTKDDPNVWGYDITDEPGAYCNRSMAVAVQTIRKYAPGKYCYVNLNPSGGSMTTTAGDRSPYGTRTYREYLERFVQEVKPDVVSYDNYNVEYSDDLRYGPRGAMHFANLFEVREVAVKYGIPFWFIGSGLSLRNYSSSPSYVRFALQAYTALAAGAKGLTWYHYYPVGRNDSSIDENGRRTIFWEYMRLVNNETRSIGTFLNDFHSTDVGVSRIWNNPNTPELPEIPNNVLVNLKGTLSIQGGYSPEEEAQEVRLMVGEFAENEGGIERVAALAVNLNVAHGTLVKFDLPEGYSKIKVVSPVDGLAEEISETKFREGFWILPGCGRLFVFEK